MPAAARAMDDLPDGLTFDPEVRGWENIRAWYRGDFVGDVHACRDLVSEAGTIYCAGRNELVLGLFESRDEGKRAIVD